MVQAQARAASSNASAPSLTLQPAAAQRVPLQSSRVAKAQTLTPHPVATSPPSDTPQSHSSTSESLISEDSSTHARLQQLSTAQPDPSSAQPHSSTAQPRFSLSQANVAQASQPTTAQPQSLLSQVNATQSSLPHASPTWISLHDAAVAAALGLSSAAPASASKTAVHQAPALQSTAKEAVSPLPPSPDSLHAAALPAAVPVGSGQGPASAADAPLAAKPSPAVLSAAGGNLPITADARSQLAAALSAAAAAANQRHAVPAATPAATPAAPAMLSKADVGQTSKQAVRSAQAGVLKPALSPQDSAQQESKHGLRLQAAAVRQHGVLPEGPSQQGSEQVSAKSQADTVRQTVVPAVDDKQASRQMPAPLQAAAVQQAVGGSEVGDGQPSKQKPSKHAVARQPVAKIPSADTLPGASSNIAAANNAPANNQPASTPPAVAAVGPAVKAATVSRQSQDKAGGMSRQSPDVAAQQSQLAMPVTSQQSQKLVATAARQSQDTAGVTSRASQNGASVATRHSQHATSTAAGAARVSLPEVSLPAHARPEGKQKPLHSQAAVSQASPASVDEALASLSPLLSTPAVLQAPGSTPQDSIKPFARSREHEKAQAADAAGSSAEHSVTLQKAPKQDATRVTVRRKNTTPHVADADPVSGPHAPTAQTASLAFLQKQPPVSAETVAVGSTDHAASSQRLREDLKPEVQAGNNKAAVPKLNLMQVGWL